MIYIEEEPFETLDIVEVAMNNDNNERKLSKQEEYNITSYDNQHASAKQNVKENQTLPQLGNMKSFTENKIRLENYQEVF